MKNITIRFKVNGKPHTATFPHDPHTAGEITKKIHRAVGATKDNTTDQEMTIDGWGFWTGYVI